MDRYGPNGNSTDSFSVVFMLDFTKIREMLWVHYLNYLGKFYFIKANHRKWVLILCDMTCPANILSVCSVNTSRAN